MAQDVINLITQDHREVERLFEQIQKDKDAEHRQQLFDKASAMLLAHSKAEEEKVYPTITKVDPSEREEIQHAEEEHHRVEQLLERLDGLRPDSNEFEELFTELVDAVQEHVDEEESETLPALENAATSEDLEELGKEFASRKEALLSKLGGGAAGVVTAEDTTKAELLDRAREAEVEGRSKMDKDELAQALDSQER